MAFAKLGDSEKAYEILSMINPINHATTEEEVERYKVEPYVMAADVYALSPHIGRGGWTWYTGSSGWMYRLIVESILGLRLEVEKLHIKPCVPSSWDTFKIFYRFRETRYQITVIQLPEDGKKQTITLDGADSHDDFINLVNDQQEHAVEVWIYRSLQQA
jgi:cellobiose phosphorylase